MIEGQRAAIRPIRKRKPMTKKTDIQIGASIFDKVKSRANEFDADIRKNPLAFKAVITVMATAETAKANADTDKNKAFYVAMRDGGLETFFDANGKQERSLAMELSGLRKCAKENIHALSDTDFKAVIKNHDKPITSARQFATDHFKNTTENTGGGAGENAGGNGDGGEGGEMPAEKSVADMYSDFIKRAFGGNPDLFWKWIEAGNADQIDAALVSAKRKAAPELPALKSITG